MKLLIVLLNAVLEDLSPTPPPDNPRTTTGWQLTSRDLIKLRFYS